MRLRERFHGTEPDALSDYELREMVLFTAQPRHDMKPLAKSLLKKFGSFAEVIHAPATRLGEVDGVECMLFALYRAGHLSRRELVHLQVKYLREAQL
jgi:DNA repair protein RadC